ncbi:hypothetical protein RWH43_06065 [Microbacterium sp. KSW2-21]|uniref:LysM domain-containing protein n=1 Tax=Microbacterium algihabitans TaxID=3075992 RepID=A0ABU3RTW6_9MICO|nr:hypothetical protein [Microbacterium sp. KSW2-21]MDU0326321.1 hypothetical protein [Microbacterium sp. KSW2-21]
MKRAAKITLAVSAVAVAGICALAIWSFPRSDAPPLIDQAAAPPSAAPTPTATPPVTELPAWAQESRPWIIYPEGFRCQGTEGCPNDFRALIGEPGDVLPDGVEYYDPAKHDYNPDDPTRFVVMPRPADGVDLGRRSGAQGFAVVSGADTTRVSAYMVWSGDSLGAIGERFAVDPARLTKNGEPVIPGETQIDPGDLLVFP